MASWLCTCVHNQRLWSFEGPCLTPRPGVPLLLRKNDTCTVLDSLNPIASPESLRRRLGASIGRAGAVALQHHIRSPAGEPLEITLLAAVHQEVVGEGVPESVRMELLDAGEIPPVLDSVPRAVGRQGAALGEEECVEVRPSVTCSHPEISVEGAGSPGAEVDGSALAALAEHDGRALVEIEIVNPQAACFADPYAAIE